MTTSDKDTFIRVDDHRSKVRLVPPDGGWGWTIVGANFVLGMLVHSVTMAYGVVYVSLVQVNGNSNTAASAIPAIFTGISNVIGPFSTSMSLYYSYRKLAFIGVALLGAGIFLSSISLRVTWLIFSFGVLGGIGHSLVTPQIFMIGQQYFHKRRVAAHALASLGNTLGFMFMPLVIFTLINLYSLQGTFLIWSAIVFNGLAATMFYHPVKWHLKAEPVKDEVEVNKEEKPFTSTSTNDETKEAKHIQHAKSSDYCDDDDDDVTESHVKTFRSIDSLEDENYDEYFLDVSPNLRPMSFMSIKSLDSFKTAKSLYWSVESGLASYCDVYGSAMSLRSRLEKNDAKTSTISLESPVALGTGTASLAYKSFENDKKIMKNGDLQQKDLNAAENASQKSEETKVKNNPYIICGLKFPRITDVISVKLLVNPIFIICVISSICNRQLYYSFATYLPFIAIQSAVEPKQVPYLLIIIATLELFSKIIMALISDKGWIARRYFYILAGVINSISVSVLGTARSFNQMAVGSALFGLGTGVSLSIGPVLLVEHLSITLLPHTYGLSMLIGGLFNLTIYLLQGWSIDATDSVQILCLTIASLALVPSILWTVASLCLLKPKSTDNLP